MKISLPYGRGTVPCDLPDGRVAGVLKTARTPPVRDPAGAVKAALLAPCGGALSPGNAARGKNGACVVISDVTRPVPYRVLLPPLLDMLENGAGLKREDILLLVATGLHRATTPGELDEMLGPDVAAGYRTANHDARDAVGHVRVGVTGGGIPVDVDRRYVEAGYRITTSLVEPHFMAGFSGGRKAICPGISSADTIGLLHGAALLAEQGVETGRVAGNPVHGEMLEGALLAGVDFSVNVTVDSERRITGVFAGELGTCHEAACRFCAGTSSASLDSAADIVLTTSAGYPLDATFYQAVKGIVAAAPVVRQGGTIIIAAECGEGMGSAEFEEMVRGFEGREAFLERIGRGAGFTVDQWQLQMLLKVQCRARVLLVAGGVSQADVAPLGISLCRTVEDALSRATRIHGEDSRVAAMPEGPYVLAGIG
ncbi:MAG: nickel-dependent lactate racemase [Planctomycetes bacterium]|nr:nickel-dependent lactate racemase [Planctomycetota bacterium]